MLVIKRGYGEKIKLSNGVMVTILSSGSKVSVGIEAPKQIGVQRSEPCVVCSKPVFDYYMGYKDIPFCGDERCARHIRANQQDKNVKEGRKPNE